MLCHPLLCAVLCKKAVNPLSNIGIKMSWLHNEVWNRYSIECPIYYITCPTYCCQAVKEEICLLACPPPHSCGSHIGFWSNATMPSEVGVATQVTVYGSWTDGCFQFPIYIRVMRCSTPSQHDFIYQYANTSSICYDSFCGMKVE
ncbi:hypothetical protein EB796_006631 [Bugula neritina]|uniref:ZP domain-containing protein n=1 Tax=Bugula neritina TaxID=10212 RepID=A0A7J7KBY3_BUGNE|nr:hypothetical protein EB796_006631 [Bugula neritina]